MAYIPEAHKKYQLLPKCKQDGYEVFSYDWTHDIDDHLPVGVSIIPYGFKSYEAYQDYMQTIIDTYGITNGEINSLGKMIAEFLQDIRKRNIKENWSVIQFVGATTPSVCGFTHGKYYYAPCFVEAPQYEGIIDDEEFTSYIGWSDYAFKPSDWKIIEDPTGMMRTFCENATL